MSRICVISHLRSQCPVEISFWGMKYEMFPFTFWCIIEHHPLLSIFCKSSCESVVEFAEVAHMYWLLMWTCSVVQHTTADSLCWIASRCDGSMLHRQSSPIGACQTFKIPLRDSWLHFNARCLLWFLKAAHCWAPMTFCLKKSYFVPCFCQLLWCEMSSKWLHCDQWSM